jgi:hypothetical protein
MTVQDESAVELFNQTLSGGLSWPILIAAALVLTGVWLGRSARNGRMSFHSSTHAERSQTGSPPAFAASDAPTVRLSDSHRVDRLHRALTLKAGQHSDLLDRTFDGVPRLRIAFIHLEDQFARIHIELGGAAASGGSMVKQIAPNQFLVPRATEDEQRTSILHFQGGSDVINILRIKVTRMCPEQQSIDLDVLHVCGNWNR